MGEQQSETLKKPLTQGSFREYSYRYINLAVYVLAALVNSLPTQTFSSINSLVEEKFDYSAVIITLNTLMFPILHPVFAFPANYILDKFGMRWGCSLGGVFVIAGVWLRTLMEVKQPAFCLVGSGLAAIGNVFILNSSSILGNNWFKPSSIPVVISLSVLANLLSITLGASLPGLILTNNSPVEDIKQLLFVQAIVITVPLILMALLMRDYPPSPPSKTAMMKKEQSQRYKEVLKQLFRNSEYLKIMVSMMFQYGTMISFLSVLDQTLSTLGYEDPGQATALTIASAMLIGIISAAIFTTAIKLTLKYKAITAGCIACGCLMMVGLVLIFDFVLTDTWILILAGAAFGFFVTPLPSLFMAYSSQVIFPLGEGSATGYLFAASQTYGFVIGLGAIAFVQNAQKWHAQLSLGVHCGLFFLSLIAILSTKQILRRTENERKKTMAPEEHEGKVDE